MPELRYHTNIPYGYGDSSYQNFPWRTVADLSVAGSNEGCNLGTAVDDLLALWLLDLGFCGHNKRGLAQRRNRITCAQLRQYSKSRSLVLLYKTGAQLAAPR